ncbi:MAG: radical SAM family heme chaperone HemW [Coriobacteriales bacterium]|jgi:oxygen-independent coproporphyrinogen-3 oxidase|nr:radical SAM family heme chaperone HemW [Coriobacteriales bacterium]
MYELLYIHLPFCRQRCAYCNFVTEAVPEDDPHMDAYLERLMRDIRAAAHAGELEHIRTMYLGGGTPTHFGHARLVELAYLLSLSIRLEQVEEYTVEANPDSLTPALAKDLYALGANRLSVGVQSFVDSELAVLGRLHTADQAAQTIRESRTRFENLSLDLICGIPGQTETSWQYSLEQALSLEPEHLSIYPLQVDHGTPLAQAINSGALSAVDEDSQAEMLEQAARVLGAQGYPRYEVASYARPGYESRHNTGYWTGVSYLGIGTGAASMRNTLEGTRERWLCGEEPELLSASEAAAEDLFLALRMSRGVSNTQLKEASTLLPQALNVFEELQSLGLVVQTNQRYLPTEKGWLLGNELYARVWALAEGS